MYRIDVAITTRQHALSHSGVLNAVRLAVLLLVTASAFCPVLLPVASAPVCNLFEGRWVVDGNRPPYQDSCPFLFNLTRCTTNGRPDNAYVRYSWYSTSCKRIVRFNRTHFGQLIKNKQIAIIGDSLTSANFVPSLLCQINQLYWVSPKPELRTLDGGAWSKDSPEAVAYVYSIPQLNATIVMLWDDYLVRINQNAAMLAKVGGITDPKPADCLIDVATPNPQWARYLDEWDAVLLETTTHWRSLSKGPRMVYTNENWSKLSLDQYQAHRWVIAGDICLCLCLSTSTSASASASTSASASASASASGDMLSLSVSPHPSPHSPLSQSLTSIC
ncbi:unnamed protein product [Closterium sp. NIES-54]